MPSSRRVHGFPLLLALALLCVRAPSLAASEGTWEVLTSPQKPGEVELPTGLALDGAGNLYVASSSGPWLHMRDPQGHWTALTPSGDGLTQDRCPESVGVDSAGRLYVTFPYSDQGLVRDPQGHWSLFATSGAGLGQYRRHQTYATDRAGNLYVADRGNDRIQVRDPQGNWSVLASAGTGLGEVKGPYGVAVDGDGTLFVTDRGNGRVQSRDPLGNWSIVASSGREVGKVYGPYAVAVGRQGNLFVSDLQGIQRRDRQGNWELIAGFGSGMGQVTGALGLVVDEQDNLIVADLFENRVLKRDSQGGWTVLAALGTAPDQMVNDCALAISDTGDLYASDQFLGRVTRRAPDGRWSVVTGGRYGPAKPSRPLGVVGDGKGNLYVASDYEIQHRNASGEWEVIANSSYASSPLSIDQEGGLLVADREKDQVRRRDSQGQWTVIAPRGTGPGQVIHPVACAPDGAGGLYLAEAGRVQHLDSSGHWTVVAESGSAVGQVETVVSLAVDGAGALYVGEQWRVQKLDPKGAWSLLTSKREIYQLRCLWVDSDLNLYVGDLSEFRLRDVRGKWSTLAVTGIPGRHRREVWGIWVDAAGSVYAADHANDCVLRRDSGGAWSMVTEPTDAPGDVDSPVSLATDGSGGLYVLEHDRLQHLDSQGRWTVMEGANPVPLPDLLSVTCGPDGGLYLAGGRGLAAWYPDTAVEPLQLADAGAELGQVSWPHYMVADSERNLYLSDRDNHRVVRRTPQDQWSVVAAAGAELGQVADPYGIALDSEGGLYVAETSPGRIQKRDAKGRWTIVAPQGTLVGQVMNGGGMAIDAGGALYVMDSGSNRIQRFTPSKLVSLGSATCKANGSAQSLTLPVSLTADAEGVTRLELSLLSTGPAGSPALTAPTFALVPTAPGWTLEVDPSNPWHVTATGPQPLSGPGEVLSLSLTVPAEAALSATYSLKAGRFSLTRGDQVTTLTGRVSPGSVEVQEGVSGGVSGDVDGNGKVTIADVLKVLRAVLGLTPLLGDARSRADANQDGLLNIQDVLLVLRLAVGMGGL